MQKLYDNICRSLSARMLNHALAMMRPWAEKTAMMDDWQMLQRDYRSLSDFFISGGDDPNRDDLLAALVHEGFVLLDKLYLNFRLLESTAYEVREMLAPQQEREQISSPAEAFRYFWLRRQLVEEDYALFTEWLARPDMLDEALMAISALTLRLARSFSEEDLHYLLIAAEEQYEIPVRERAWIGVLLIMGQYDYRMHYYPQLEAQLQDLLMLEEGLVFARTALTCLIRTMGIEWAAELQQQLQASVAPLTARLFDRLPKKGESQLPPEEMDDLSRTIDESLRQSFSRHQEDIAVVTAEQIDMNYSTMRGLYSSAFFSSPERYFLPYDESYIPEGMRGRTPSFPGFDGLCDSDKYAMCTVSAHMPNIKDIVEQSGIELPEELSEALKSLDNKPAFDKSDTHTDKSDTPADTAESNSLSDADAGDSEEDHAEQSTSEQGNAERPQQPRHIFFHFEGATHGDMLCNAYVQQLFRFCTLNPWQVAQPLFMVVPHLPELNLYLLLNPTANEKMITAEHYYRCHAFAPAAMAFSQIVGKLSIPRVHQEFGLSLQKMGRFAEALIAYQHAEGTEWVLRQRLFCQTQLSQYDAAIDTLDKLLAAHPDNTEYLLAKSRCLMSLELYAEAMQVLYQIDLLRPDNPTVSGNLSWCAFLCDRLDEAEKYQLRIPADRRSPSDNINYGHIHFVRGRRAEALRYYTMARHQCDTLKTFLSLFRPDRKFLLEKGLSKPDIYLMEDQLLAV